MPPHSKANFKTYESSTRLLAAVVGSLQGKVKLDFTELARLIGGGTTAPAVDHRLRPIKQLSRLQHIWLEQGKDPGELPVDKAAIQKLYGESTASGIEWQFREIKALSRAQQKAVDEDGDPAACKPSACNTPSSRANGSATPGSRTSKASKKTPTAGAGNKRKRPNVPLHISSEDSELDGGDTDYSAKDRQPTSNNEPETIDDDDDVAEGNDDDDGSDLLAWTPTPKRPKAAPAAKATATKRGRKDTVVKSEGDNNNNVARSLFRSKSTGNGNGNGNQPSSNGTVRNGSSRNSAYVVLDEPEPGLVKPEPGTGHDEGELPSAGGRGSRSFGGDGEYYEHEDRLADDEC